MKRDSFLMPPTEGQCAALAGQMGCSPEVARGRLEAQREAVLQAAKADPLRAGFEPPIWMVARALLDSPVCPEMQKMILARTFNKPEGEVFAWFKEAMRERLGFKRPVSELLMLGANRAGKTDFSVKYALELGMTGKKGVFIASQTFDTSRQVQQKRFWHYLPSELRGDLKTQQGYIRYTQKNGFTGNAFILPGGSEFGFHAYRQDLDMVEGREWDLCWGDEDIPLDWVTTLRLRVASKRGKMLLTFTPLWGYTPVVAEYLDGMQVVRQCQGYMLPRDGGPPAPWLQLGLTQQEYRDLEQWSFDESRREEAFHVPEARPENCFDWLNDTGSIQRNEAPGRVWELVPRVARCANPDRAVLWIHGRDNPYGMPGVVIRKAAGNLNATAEIKTRVYGIALKQGGKRFAAFDRKIHVVPDESVPAEGINILVADPAPERNWWLMWLRVTRSGVYIYREFPGTYELPGGLGVPAPWAKVSSRKGGVNDGDRDDGTRDFGWGYSNYKYLVAHLEGWRDYENWIAAGHDPLAFPPADELENWVDGNGSRENVERRIVDGRAAAASERGLLEAQTRLDILNSLGMTWEPASGKSIGSGEDLIREALALHEGKAPRLFIAASCRNTLFAFEHYTGADGQKGACKEAIDTCRYFYQAGCHEMRLPESNPTGDSEYPIRLKRHRAGGR